MQLINYRLQRQWIDEGKKLNPTLVENNARIVYSRDSYIKDLAEKLDCSIWAIYAAFKGKAPLRLFVINEHLKSFPISESKLTDTNNKNLD